MTDNPIFILAHGSWHKPYMYDPLRKALAERGFTLITPVLPTMGNDATGIAWEADVQVILDEAKALFAKGREVILIGHSYGGVPASVSTRGNGVAERKAAGLSGGFRHIIFLSSFAIPATGLTLISLIGGAFPEWVDVIEAPGKKQTRVNEKSIALFYNDLTPDKAQAIFDDLVPQSYAAVTQPVDFSVLEITIPKTYIVCEKDLAFLPSDQRRLLTDVGMREASVNGGHSAFISVPDELAGVLAQIASDS
ncbi:hypothetical protein NPX13_g5339 [Xylaria arbuscula]|uniref:AB hydrolase-1 domain-containing protein n=1 Tax=Xylaria arbuscula TaxID=114810 RepID=A0A9W8TN86_9PEZI|nr:hypothetical protein NPX13_g5339 [Xylaria arbuscula]